MHAHRKCVCTKKGAAAIAHERMKRTLRQNLVRYCSTSPNARDMSCYVLVLIARFTWSLGAPAHVESMQSIVIDFTDACAAARIQGGAATKCRAFDDTARSETLDIDKSDASLKGRADYGRERVRKAYAHESAAAVKRLLADGVELRRKGDAR